MGGIMLLAGFEICGLITMDVLLRRKSGLIRIWMGLVCGLMLMMWLPTLYAFFLNFTVAAQWLGLATAGLIAAAAAWRMCRKAAYSGTFCGGMPVWLPVVLVVPLALLTGWLEYTHVLRNVNGALHVGQSTYGDINLHLGITMSLRNAVYPPDYSILAGTPLGYPFFADSMATSMVLFGSSAAQAYIVTGTLMSVLVYLGFVIFVWDLAKRPLPVILAFVLMFLNGGLGFLYTLDGVMKDSTALQEVFTGFYKTPTNQPDLNLRWVNVVCDMLLPQRTLACGWMALLPALWLLLNAMRENRRGTFVLLGVWAGAMPMVHTHSFLCLGMISAAAMLCRAIRPGRETRKSQMINFVIYGGIAVALAVPQLLTWTFPQSFGSSSLKFRFNWVNNQGNGRLIDEYFWFWIKNVGPVYLLIVPAVLSRKKGSPCRMLGLGALLIYAAAECFQFQTNVYDNNKLFYVAYMAVLPSVGLYLAELWERLKGLRGRAFLAACFMVICTLSAVLSIGREVVSDYQLFSASEVEAAEFIDENTDPNGLFLTGHQHNNAVTALAGRHILCGASTFLYYHGLDYAQQEADTRLLYESPEANEGLFDEYGIDYVYISGQERSSFAVDEQYFAEHGTLLYDSGDIRIYALSEAARAFCP